MSPRTRYKTKQRELLLDYFETVPGIHVTANDVWEYFKTHEAEIGKATVYRQLEKLVDDGVIKKYVIDSSSAACFEYTGPDDGKDAGACIHCKCEKCGKLFHFRCDRMDEIQACLLEEHMFRIDHMRTVFYGLCENCS